MNSSPWLFVLATRGASLLPDHVPAAGTSRWHAIEPAVLAATAKRRLTLDHTVG
jgi:hypothetical protein